jgi:type II secretory pathway pseudopilin PulG
MTLIELGVVMSIVTVMLALVLGLGRHVNEAIKYRRAQADLGEWLETLNAWYLKYGMYPDPVSPSGLRQIESNLVWLASTDIGTQYALSLSSGERVTFSSLASKPLKTSDPWGTPYFYLSRTNSYELLSCGPDAQHTYTDGQTTTLFPDTATTVADPNADDVYFEP